MAISTHPLTLKDHHPPGHHSARHERSWRVLFLSDHLGHANGRIHGVTTYFLETLPALGRGRVTPTLCILQPYHRAATRFAAAGVEPIFLGRAKWDPRSFFDLLRLLRRHDIDLLHVSGEKSLLLGRMAARIERLPVVAHFHDTLPAPGPIRVLQRRLAAHTDLALAVSRPIREFAIREFALAPARTRVLHNGLGVERFAPPAAEARLRIRRELGLDPSNPVIGLIGRVHPDKGQKFLIRAMPRLLACCPQAIAVIVGDGPDRDACAALVKKLALGERVRFMGQHDDIPAVLAAVDVVAVPSLWEEPFGFVALEAMAAGRPVVASRIGGLPELVRHGETGFLVPPGDEGSLTDALADVLNHPQLAERLGAAAIRHAQGFSVHRHVQHLEELYDTIGRKYSPDRSERGANPVVE